MENENEKDNQQIQENKNIFQEKIKEKILKDKRRSELREKNLKKNKKYDMSK